jgi:hypothetical protein
LDEVQTPKPKRERIVWIGKSPNHINLSVCPIQTILTGSFPSGILSRFKINLPLLLGSQQANFCFYEY